MNWPKERINKFLISNKAILVSIVFVFLIKLVLSLLPSFQIDMGTWIGWSNRLRDLGFANFYSEDTWTQYTPGFLYYLWAIGKLGIANELTIKLVTIFGDVATGLLIFNLLKKINKKWALLSFFIYTLNPVVVFDGSVWGQIDGILTLFLVLSIYYLVEKKGIVLSIIFWAIAFLIKPQAIAIFPVLVFAIITKRFSFAKVAKGVVAGLSIIFLGSIPFFPNNTILGLPQLVLKMIGSYSYTTVNAFNIWSWVGMWKPDSSVFIGLTLSTWGNILLLLSIVFPIFIYRKNLNNKAIWYLLSAVLCLSFFLFPTKVHERYLFPFFAFLLIGGGLIKSKNILIIYIVASIITVLNLYYPYAYYTESFLAIESLQKISLSLAKPISLIFVLVYFCVIFWKNLPKIKFPKPIFLDNGIQNFPKFELTKKWARNILILILVFAFTSRIYNLGSPSAMYFDEVYHAFTAKVMMGSDPAKAWEWWNTPPEGFAYEWTHPPVAKLGMVLGMSIFGQNSFGWRIPGVLLGVGSVFLVYLIAKHVFKDELVGLLSAGVFSLDGLPLVLSRIGMNDSYLLFFSLMAIYLFMKGKDFSSAIFIGLALASKWSALWATPIIFVLWLKRKKKFKFSILWFLLLPPIVYLASYIPMFTTNHSLETWWGMQEQMWWYHTGLRATHPYSSPWWTWPFLIRPVYLYTSDEVRNLVSRIYLMGNPIVFWSGLTSVVVSGIYSFYEKNKNLGLIVFSYLIFFVPWAMSPRIMFLYHYLPSIPFMSIAIAYVLRRNLKLALFMIPVFAISFIYFYPHWAGLQIPLWLDKSYYWVNSWR